MKVAVSGATGRMGKMIIEAVLAADDMQLVAALCPANATEVGTDAGLFLGKTTGVLLTSDTDVLQKADVLIDFTRPEATLSYLKECVKTKTALVIGTTGFDAAGKKAIEETSSVVPTVCAPNMSIGVNTVFSLIAKAAALLPDYDCEIVEMHHKHKVDAPSGTALEMGRRVALARGVDFDEKAMLSRKGHTGPRESGTIGFAALRGGDIVGDHTVIFAGPGERIEISHKSGSRVGYAQGSLTAARFILKKNKGLFSMSDVLELA